MSKSFQIFFFFFLVTQISFAQWFWQNPLPDGNSLTSVKFVNSNTGWAVGSDRKILNTTNGGNNWTSQTSGTTDILYSVNFTDANTGWAVSQGGTILKTINGGNIWTLQASGTNNWLLSVYFTDANTGWVVGGDQLPSDGIILKTTNGGTNWGSQTSVSPNRLTSVYFTDVNTGWAVGNYGTILKTMNGGVTFVNEEQIDEMPKEFLLSQNYPNPFNPSTKVKYAISNQQYATLKVYDILGNEIETLVNEEKPTGTYEVTWNAASLPSGVYFYQLRAGSFVETRKMILLR